LVVAQRLRRHRAQFGDAPLEMGLPAQQPERQRERRQRPAPQQRQQGLVPQVALQQGAVEVDALGDAGLVARRARSHAGTVWITRSVPHSDAPGSARLTWAILTSANEWVSFAQLLSILWAPAGRQARRTSGGSPQRASNVASGPAARMLRESATSHRRC